MPYLSTLLIATAYLSAFALATFFARVGIIPLRDESRRIGQIDGLRGYLALSVAVHHFVLYEELLNGRPWNGLQSNFLDNLGKSSVAIFFMITGVLFYRIVQRRGLATDWVSLYISRLFRLTPMLWLVTAIVVVIVLASGGVPRWEDIGALARWLSFLGQPDLFDHAQTFMINAGVLWTLKYEMAFYIGLPIVALLLHFGQTRFVRLACLGIATLALFSVYNVYVAQFELGLIAYFPLGMMLAECAEIGAVSRRLNSHAAAVVSLAALALQMFAFKDASDPIQASLLAIAFAPVVAGNSYFGLLRLKGSLALGEISYSIYMLHGIVLYVLMTGLFEPYRINPDLVWILFPMIALGIVVVAAISYRLIERPGIDLGRRLANWIAAQRTERRAGPTAVKGATPRRSPTT